MDLYPIGDTVSVRGDFNATTGTGRDDYESCVGPHGYASRDETSRVFLDFAKNLEIEDSWIFVPEAGFVPQDLVFQ